ncbi:Type IV secretion system VirB6 domain containing protein [Candidatus Cyrtobacter comes]|uniref:Type IV secretion system VirB6 domain containing protein n=1 Tax=Candidatus Cyrtobacter comes TaxID=675776 RepID=A0ABU5LA86_9RICK|nr:Type IV secretion system VirB6 domain containing protein [Candidatus Cyrtobacter comes]
MPNDSADPRAKYSGGIDVTVSWRGCPIEKGQGLQYAIVYKNTVKDLYEPENAKWYNVPLEILDGTKTLKPIFEQQDKKGVLFFKINPAQVQGACGAGNCTFYNMAGSYAVMVVKKDDGDSAFKPVSQIVNRIYNYFFKYDSKDRADGVVKKVFENLIKGKNFIGAIQTTLAIYIAISAASFLIGIANFNKQELANRLIKTSVVIALISERSWEFFNDTFFNFVTTGSADIISRILSGASVFNYNNIDLSNGPGAIFSIFDQPFKELFGRATWIKISALLLSNLFSIVIALVVIFASVIFVVCIGTVNKGCI